METTPRLERIRGVAPESLGSTARPSSSGSSSCRRPVGAGSKCRWTGRRARPASRCVPPVGRGRYAHERFRITRKGQPVAAIVPLDDLEAMQALEDAMDVKTARESLRDAEEHGGTVGAEAFFSIRMSARRACKTRPFKGRKTRKLGCCHRCIIECGDLSRPHANPNSKKH